MSPRICPPIYVLSNMSSQWCPPKCVLPKYVLSNMSSPIFPPKFVLSNMSIRRKQFENKNETNQIQPDGRAWQFPLVCQLEMVTGNWDGLSIKLIIWHLLLSTGNRTLWPIALLPHCSDSRSQSMKHLGGHELVCEIPRFGLNPTTNAKCCFADSELKLARDWSFNERQVTLWKIGFKETLTYCFPESNAVSAFKQSEIRNHTSEIRYYVLEIRN